jgi:hypothetical protein
MRFRRDSRCCVNHNVRRPRATTAGLGFVEIVVAIVVAAVAMIPIFYSVTSSRSGAAKAINYLRAIELANECIEWVAVIPFAELTPSKVSSLDGSLYVGTGGSPAGMVLAGPPAHPKWRASGQFADSLTYGSQYDRAFFWRAVKVEDVNTFGMNRLKRVSVDIEWNEGVAPANPNNRGDRMRKITLSTLVFNDELLDY